MDISEVEILEGNLSDLKNVHRRLVTDFAANELKDYGHLESLLLKEKYKLFLAKAKQEIVGYAFIYEIEHLPALWLDYMAIEKQFQNAGLGSRFFNKIIQSKQDGLNGMFIEVEIPEEDKNTREQQIRRINFYERLGARRLKIPYKLPTNEAGFPMYLYFRPSSNIHRLPKEQTQAAIAEVFDYIHSDIKDRDATLSEFSTFIADEYFD